MHTLTAIVPATDRPATLDRATAAIAAASAPPEEVLVIDAPLAWGPAAARNAGAARATGDLLVFVDADVEVHGDAFARIRAAFDRDPSLTALFGSYDAEPDATGFVSAFRNLLHHHVHQTSVGPATTFWAGLGAVRRDALLAAGGFDAERFPAPSIEDVELGMRLTDAGARIELHRDVLGRHLKAWRLGQMVRGDLCDRGAPWVALLLRRRRTSDTLNLARRHRLSMLASIALVASWRRPAIAVSSLGALLLLNRSFYALLWRRRGPFAAVGGVALHVVHHLTGAAAVPVGALTYLRERGMGASGRGPSATPSR